MKTTMMTTIMMTMMMMTLILITLTYHKKKSISRACFHVKHAQLRSASTSTKTPNDNDDNTINNEDAGNNNHCERSPLAMDLTT